MDARVSGARQTFHPRNMMKVRSYEHSHTHGTVTKSHRRMHDAATLCASGHFKCFEFMVGTLVARHHICAAANELSYLRFSAPENTPDDTLRGSLQELRSKLSYLEHRLIVTAPRCPLARP